MKKLLISFTLALVMASCSTQRAGNFDQSASSAALSGGLIGAGAGAIIGSVIKNGSIARSALLGGGIGIAAGLILAGGSETFAMNSTVDSQQEQIRQNNEQLRTQRRTIDELRYEIDEQGRAIELDSSRRSTVYDGATLGSYFR